MDATPARSATPGLDRVPPVGLVLGGVASVQVGAAFATQLFDDLGSAGTVLLRILIAAVVLVALWRPRPAEHATADLRLAAVFGLTLAGMNLSFYEAIDRIPLGIAVTLEFVGPLGVAVAGSRRPLDLVWVGLATVGILLLSDFGTGGDLDTTGILLALVAGAFWAAYILLAARAGRAFAGGTGLSIAMAVGAAALLAPGIAGAGTALLRPELLAGGAAVALLSSVIPYSLETQALRRLPTQVFGVLMSLEPGMAALAGFAVAGQDLAAGDLAAIALVTAASAGAAASARDPARDPL